MEYANEEIFNIRYNEKEDCLETGKKILFVKKHKLMSVIIASTIVLIGVNSVLIYEFFNILAMIS